MKYSVAADAENAVKIPQSVISQLERLPKNKEFYFRVALFVLSEKKADISLCAEKLGLTEQEIKAAFDFWHGAGLLNAEDTGKISANLIQRPAHLTTKEVFEHSRNDKNISVLLQEAQQIFGEVIGQSEANILVSLYINDKMPVDYLLTGIAHFKAEGMRPSRMRGIEKTFLKWYELGIKTTADIEEYLKLLEKRREYQRQTAEILHISPDSFSYSECCKISQWFEEYGYTEPIISHAALVAGEKATVAYIGGILRKWHAKGYRTVKEVLAGESGQNAVTAAKQVKSGTDILQRSRKAAPEFKK